MRPLLIVLIICSITLPSMAQTLAGKVDEAYQIPFATSDNRIELDVVNTGALPADEVLVKAVEKPEWLTLDEEEFTLPSLPAGKEEQVQFRFSVDKMAQVGQPTILKFEITSNNQVIGTKEFLLSVEAPREAALMQNYPNPFNPETTIGFDVPARGNVDLRVFDILGREVAILAKEEKAAGHHQVRWDASRFASGTYFYVLKTRGKAGEQVILSQKMLLVK